MTHTLNAFVFLLLALSFNHAVAQSCFDEIANIEIPEEPHKLEKNSEAHIEFLTNTYCFLSEELDSIDLEIMLQNAYLEVIVLLDRIENTEALTYRDLKDLMIDFTNDGGYLKIRGLHLMTRDFSLLPAIYENWDKDKHVLLNLGIPEGKLEPFRGYLKNHPNTGKTYQELMMEFEQSKVQTIDQIEE